jgi:hypothetical protein
MSINVFLSTVSDEFRSYRDQLCHDLTRHNVAVKVQEDFKGLGGDTLDKLDVYIAHCDAVVHLMGEMTGSTPAEWEEQALLRKYPDLAEHLPPLDDALRQGARTTLAPRLRRSGKRRVTRRGWSKRSSPFATPLRNGLASACRSNGR